MLELQPTTYEQVEDFLDQTCAPMVSQKSFFERSAIREELREHLHALIRAAMELGASETEAARDALKKMGKPNQIARAFGVRRKLPWTQIGLSVAFLAVAWLGQPKTASVEARPRPPEAQLAALSVAVPPGMVHQDLKGEPCTSCHATTTWGSTSVNWTLPTIQPRSDSAAVRRRAQETLRTSVYSRD